MAAQVVRLDLLLQLLDRMFQQSAPQASTASLTLLMASVLKVRQSGRAVKLLAEEGMVEDILAIGRTLVEVTVNACYLQCVNDKELGSYLSFHPELGHGPAGLARQRPGGSFAQGLMVRLGDFVTSLVPAGKRQKADPSWTSHSLATRAQLSDDGNNIPLMSLLLARCYPRGDAAVHGTVGALDSFLTAMQTGEMPVRQDRFRELSEALFGVNLTLMTFGLFLNEFFQLGMDEAMDQISAADSTTRPSLAGEYNNG